MRNTSVSSVSSLEALLEMSERAMVAAGYKKSTIYCYRRHWKELLAFARAEMQQDFLNNELIEDWLASKGYAVGCWPLSRPLRLRCILAALRILVAVHEPENTCTGIPSPVLRSADREGVPCFRALRPPVGRCKISQRIEMLPVSAQQAFASYEQDCHNRGCRPATIKNVRLYLPRFFHFLADRGVCNFERIAGSHISDYVVSLHDYAPSTVAQYMSYARCMLRFLYRQGLIPVDLSSAVPPSPIRIYRKIPTVWTPEEITLLLAQVDRGSPVGKRDFAILLLAARLGMRVGDIIRLTTDDLKWDQHRIEIVQSKTRQPLVLPLMDEVGWALIDYLKHARPVSPHRRVFLSMRPPFGPFVDFDNLHHIITRYRRKAGIQKFKRQPVGMHALRHSLATNLLSDSASLYTISDVLGHTTIESTEVYTKVSLPQLRCCAIDLEEATDDTI